MKLFTNSMEVDTRLGVAERTAYGLGNFANAFIFIAIMAFLTFYYTDVIGLNAGVIGIIMLVSRVFDGITDLVMGYIVDHTKPSRFGKTRTWFLRSCIPFAISGVLVFMVPSGASDIIKYIFVFLTYNLCNAIFYTAVTVSYNTLMVNITRNSLERGILGIFLMVCSTLGGLVVTSSCLYLIKNKYWIMLAGSFAVYWIGYTLMNSGHIYYAQYILGDQGYQPVIANVIQVVTLIAMLAAFIPMRLLGKGNSVRIGALIAVIAYALQIFVARDYTGILICSALKGFGYGMFCAVIGGMNPDALDYGEWKFHKNVTGMGVAAVSFGQKVGTGLGGAIFGLVLDMGHYDGTAAVQAESALRSISINYTWLPLICAILSLVFMLGYNLDKKLPQIQEELKNGRTEGRK